MINGLDLFSGIGGLSIALNEWVKPIAYCEIDTYCQGVLLSRIATGKLENAPIWDDIKTLDGSKFARGYVDILFGGFPCQDISVAGRGKGLEGERSGLFFEIVRLAQEIKPKFIFIENVPSIRNRGGIRVVTEITKLGYDCRWCVLSAASVGALHLRERWFLLGYAKYNGRDGSQKYRSTQTSIHDIEKGEDKTSQSQGSGSPPMLSPQSICFPFKSRRHWRETVSDLRRVSDGVPLRVDRIRVLGNSVVPIQAKEAFKILMGIK